MKINLPLVPNFVGWTDGKGNDIKPVPIGELTDAQLNKIADIWREELLYRARKIRTGGKPVPYLSLIDIEI